MLAYDKRTDLEAAVAEFGPKVRLYVPPEEGRLAPGWWILPMFVAGLFAWGFAGVVIGRLIWRCFQ